MVCKIKTKQTTKNKEKDEFKLIYKNKQLN